MQFKMVLAGLAAFSLSASGLAQSSAPGAGDFSADAFRAHVTFLADDLLEGREAGTRGFDIASRYVATQFEALGLTPGASGAWYQPIEFVRASIAGTPTLTIDGRTFTNGREMVMRASAETMPLDVTAPLVFVGYGLDMPSHGFNDYQGLDVRGKIVVALTGTPSGTPSDVAAHLNGDKRRMAAARGAIGMITVRTRADASQGSWERTVRGANRPLTTWVEPGGEPFGDGSGLRFSALVDDSTANALFQGARRPLSQVLDEAAQNGGRPHGFALHGTAHVSRAPAELSRFASRNVLAVLPGSDRERGGLGSSDR